MWERICKEFREITDRKVHHYFTRLYEWYKSLNGVELTEEEVRRGVVEVIQKMKKTRLKGSRRKMEYTETRSNNKIYLRPRDAAENLIVSEEYLIETKEMYKDYMMGKDRGVSIVRDKDRLLFNEEYWKGINMKEYSRLCDMFNYGRVTTLAEIGLKSLFRGLKLSEYDRSSAVKVFGEPDDREGHQADPWEDCQTHLIEEGEGVYEIDMTAGYVQILSNDRLPKNQPIGGKPIEGYVEPTENVIYKYEIVGGRTSWYNNRWIGEQPKPHRVERTYRYMPIDKGPLDVIHEWAKEVLGLRKDPEHKGIYKMIGNTCIGKLKRYWFTGVDYIWTVCREEVERVNELLKSAGWSIQGNHTDSIRFYGKGLDIHSVNIEGLNSNNTIWRLESNEPLDVISYDVQVQQFRDKEGKVSWKHAGIRGACPPWGKMPKTFTWSRLKIIGDEFKLVENSHSVKGVKV